MAFFLMGLDVARWIGISTEKAIEKLILTTEKLLKYESFFQKSSILNS
jgi:hypothetical protein